MELVGSPYSRFPARLFFPVASTRKHSDRATSKLPPRRPSTSLVWCRNESSATSQLANTGHRRQLLRRLPRTHSSRSPPSSLLPPSTCKLSSPHALPLAAFADRLASEGAGMAQESDASFGSAYRCMGMGRAACTAAHLDLSSHEPATRPDSYVRLLLTPESSHSAERDLVVGRG